MAVPYHGSAMSTNKIAVKLEAHDEGPRTGSHNVEDEAKSNAPDVVAGIGSHDDDKCAAALAHILTGLPLAAQAAFAAASGAVIGASVAGLSTHAAKVRVFAAVRGAITSEFGAADAANGEGDIVRLEEVLLAFRPVISGTNITDAKAWLRSVGSHKIASRLGRLSKSRNQQAHPDRAILQDVQEIVASHLSDCTASAGTDPTEDEDRSQCENEGSDTLAANSNTPQEVDVAQCMRLVCTEVDMMPTAVNTTVQDCNRVEAFADQHEQNKTIAGVESRSELRSNSTSKDMSKKEVPKKGKGTGLASKLSQARACPNCGTTREWLMHDIYRSKCQTCGFWIGQD